jgi:hypothetical protein
MSVQISENLVYEMVELLTEPKCINPSNDECVLHLGKRNKVLDQLLILRRQILEKQSRYSMVHNLFPLKNSKGMSTP